MRNTPRLATEFCSEKIPRNRLGMVSVIPRKKVVIPRHSEVTEVLIPRLVMEGNGMKKISFTKNPAPANTMFSSETASERNSESLLLFLFHGTEFRAFFTSAERNSESFLFCGTAGIPSEQTNCSAYSVFRGIIFCRKLPTLNTHLNCSPVQEWEAACPCCSPSPPLATWASPTPPRPTPTSPTTWPVSPLVPFASQKRRNGTGPSLILYQRYADRIFLVTSFLKYLMLSFFKVCKCYHFCAIIFSSTYWALSSMFSFGDIISVII